MNEMCGHHGMVQFTVSPGLTNVGRFIVYKDSLTVLCQ